MGQTPQMCLSFSGKGLTCSAEKNIGDKWNKELILARSVVFVLRRCESRGCHLYTNPRDTRWWVRKDQPGSLRPDFSGNKWVFSEKVQWLGDLGFNPGSDSHGFGGSVSSLPGSQGVYHTRCLVSSPLFTAGLCRMSPFSR